MENRKGLLDDTDEGKSIYVETIKWIKHGHENFKAKKNDNDNKKKGC